MVWSLVTERFSNIFHVRHHSERASRPRWVVDSESEGVSNKLESTSISLSWLLCELDLITAKLIIWSTTKGSFLSFASAWRWSRREGEGRRETTETLNFSRHTIINILQYNTCWEGRGRRWVGRKSWSSLLITFSQHDTKNGPLSLSIAEKEVKNRDIGCVWETESEAYQWPIQKNPLFPRCCQRLLGLWIWSMRLGDCESLNCQRETDLLVTIQERVTEMKQWRIFAILRMKRRRKMKTVSNLRNIAQRMELWNSKRFSSKRSLDHPQVEEDSRNALFFNSFYKLVGEQWARKLFTICLCHCSSSKWWWMPFACLSHWLFLD